MTEERYSFPVSKDGQLVPLSKSEIEEGWHYCSEFDGLLVGPKMSELNCCRCLPSDHHVYATAPIEEPGFTIFEGEVEINQIP